MPLAIEVLPKAGANGAFFDDCERRRQSAGPEQNGKVVGAFNGEAARDLTGPPKNGFANDGRGDHLVVKNDRKRLADILLRHLREFTGAGCIEAEINDRLACALIKAGLGISQIAARYKDPLFNQIRCPWLRGAVENFGVGRHPPLQCLLGRNGYVDHAEIELGRFSEQFLQPCRVLQARNLYENPISPLPLDERLDGSELVYAPFDDLN